MKRRFPPRLRPRHHDVLKYLLQNPGASTKEIGDATGYTRWQISRIVRSYEFRVRFNAITQEAMVRLYQNGLVERSDSD